MKAHAIEARNRLCERMKPASVAVFFSGKPAHKTHDQYYTHTPQRNFFYLTNLNEPNMILVLLKGKTDVKTFLFIEQNTDFITKWEGGRMEKEVASDRSGTALEDIRYLDQFEPFFNAVMNYARAPFSTPPQTLYLDLYHPRFGERALALQQADTIIRNYPELRVANINAHLSELRMVKTPAEIERIRAAVELTNVGLNVVMKQLSVRTHEYELAADFQHAITLNGSDGCAFDTIAAGGKNATSLHYIANRSALKPGELVLFDLGAVHENYAADISRTYPVSGVFSKRQKELYNIVLNVNKATIAHVKPGVTWKELNAFAKDMLAKEAKRIKLIEEDEDITRYYYHSVGHFLGLDVHDVGLTDRPFEAGMVLTVEPGLYIAEENIGIRIEDDVLVTDAGAENLSAGIIKEVDALEHALKLA